MIVLHFDKHVEAFSLTGDGHFFCCKCEKTLIDVSRLQSLQEKVHVKDRFGIFTKPYKSKCRFFPSLILTADDSLFSGQVWHIMLALSYKQRENCFATERVAVWATEVFVVMSISVAFPCEE